MGFQDFRALRSRHPAIRTTGLLTFAPAGLSPAEHTSVYWLQHPDVPISGIRLVWGFSCQGGRQHDLLFPSWLSWPFLLFDRAAGFLPAPTARCQSRRAQRQSRTARFFRAARRALSLTDVRTAACCNDRVRLD